MAILTAIESVFTNVGQWISNAIQAMIPIFWDASANSGAGSLTLLGVLAVVGLAFSIVFLIVGIIQKFLHFGG